MPSRKELANAIRALSMDAVQKANSGHPGAPMGMADIAEVLWNDFLQHNPTNPHWLNRDRFVLSNGHGSMLIYSLLHLSGYDLAMEEIRQFRQLGSKTPGHPEYGDTPGVETTTGPLGQGISNAVGMAIAEKLLAQHFNRDGHSIVDHHTYVFLGDGCLMEGISHEACSLAGTHGLGKLIAFYDDNGISIDGHVEGWFSDDTPQRFQAYGWHVIANVNGHDSAAIRQAIGDAQGVHEQPTLICCKTVIGFGAPNLCGTAKTHGEALGEKEIAATRENINWNHEPFVIPKDIAVAWDARSKGQEIEQAWNKSFTAYKTAFPELAAELMRRIQGELPANWHDITANQIASFNKDAPNEGSRDSSKNTLNAIGPIMPELIGGSADLSGSNKTKWSGAKDISKTELGNYFNYGVREFAMTAIANGIALHGGFIPYVGTFLVFSDYARNAVRMAALMKIQNILVYSHDSIGLGEDGPTHQPIEHTASLRLIPNLNVWRPCDAVETAVSWVAAVERKDGPTALILSRQKLPNLPRDQQVIANIRRGGYVLHDCTGTPQAIIIATGSEVDLAMAAVKRLAAEGKKIRLVSMPCTELFERQDATYKESVLPVAVTARVAVEAGVADAWYRYVGTQGKVLGINRFGASAPYGQLYEKFNLTCDSIHGAVSELL